jgi:hypothetical protein
MINIPALRDAANDQPLQFTPACIDAAIPVCLNPAYTSYLPVTADALAPLLRQLAGLPGAPDRIVQAGVTYQQDTGNGVTVRAGRPSPSGPHRAFGLVLPDQLSGPLTTPGQMASQVVATYGPLLVARVIGDGPAASPAQNAVAAALLQAAGQSGLLMDQPFAGRDGPDASRSPGVAPGTPEYAAAERFAALPESARRGWLLGHLAALRAGQIALAQIP